MQQYCAAVAILEQIPITLVLVLQIYLESGILNTLHLRPRQWSWSGPCIVPASDQYRSCLPMKRLSNWIPFPVSYGAVAQLVKPYLCSDKPPLPPHQVIWTGTARHRSGIRHVLACNHITMHDDAPWFPMNHPRLSLILCGNLKAPTPNSRFPTLGLLHLEVPWSFCVLSPIIYHKIYKLNPKRFLFCPLVPPG